MKALVRSHPSPPRKLGTSPRGEAFVEALVRAGTQKSPSAAQLDAER